MRTVRIVALKLTFRFHKRRAAHGKVIKAIKELLSFHGYSSSVFCCYTLYAPFSRLSIDFEKKHAVYKKIA